MSAIRAERLPVKTYTVADGLPRDDARCIREDSRGFMWFCTFEGLSRFDGYAFTNFNASDGLPDRHVNDLLETRSGIYLVATDAGIAILNPTGLRGSASNPLFRVHLPENPKAKSAFVLFEDQSGVVLVGTSSGLYKLKPNFEFEIVNLGEASNDEPAITSIIQDRAGVYWIGTLGRGLFRVFPDGTTEHYASSDGLPFNYIASLLEDRDGRIWVGFRSSPKGGLVKLVARPVRSQPIVEREFTVADGLPSSWVPSLYQSSDGVMWVGTTRGLCQWQGENSSSVCKTYTTKNDICDLDIWSVFQDKDGNLWTSSACGVKRLSRYGFTIYDEADGLSSARIVSIFENSSKELFVSSLFNGLHISRYDGNKFFSLDPNLPKRVKYFGWGWKQTVWQDRKGAWWIPTGEGLFRFSNVKEFSGLSRAAPEEMKTGGMGKEPFRLFEDSRGDVWVAMGGNPNELLRWERATNTWHDYSQTVGFSTRPIGVTVFLEDRSGNLWIATGSDAGESGLIRYRDGKFRVFTEADHAPPGWTRDLYVDQMNRLWIANTTWGLLRLDDVNADNLNFVRYTMTEGLSSNGAYCITSDEFGRIYVGTGRGLDRLNPTTGQIENFTTADGLPNSNVNVAYRDTRDTLWFATANGLARFQPEPERQRKPPIVLVSGLRVNGIARPVSLLGEADISGLDLESDQRQVSVDFIGLGATLGEKLRYEYRLTGEDWIQTNERTVNFAKLSAGSYRFEVRAISADQIYSQPASLSFRTAAPLWQRWWFLLLMGSIVAIAIYGIYRNRLARYLEMEQMRTRIATDLHDDIGASLTRISLLSEVAKQRPENEMLLTSIADISRESVTSMSDIVWAISPDHDRLLDLTRRMRQHAEEVFSSRDIELEFNAIPSDADAKLNVNVRRDILLIFKEAVNNAVRHSNCTKVRIDFLAEDRVLVLQVHDNGKGFETESQSDGHGLRSMAHRAANIGGTLTISSRAGTLVRLELPLSRFKQV